jgi:anti-anti-sigma factor
VLRVAGELDILTSPELGALVGDRSRRYRTVVVELEDVDFIDSSGVNTILVADQDCRRDGCRLVATEGSRQVRRVLELCGLLGRPPFVQSTPFGSHALSTSKAGTRTRPRRRVVPTDGPRAGIVTIPQRGPAAQ